MSDAPAAARNQTSAASPVSPQIVPPLSPWLLWLSRLPWALCYGIATVLSFFVSRVVRYRRAVVDANLARVFPALTTAQRRQLAHAHYAGTLDMVVELIKTPTLTAEELRRRVRFVNLEEFRAAFAAGKPVLGVAAHQCNWEWILQGMALELGLPIDAAYKPLKDRWSERQFLAIRSRFGCRMVPAKNLLAEVIRLRQQLRAIVLVADQEPVTAERKHWLKFFGQDTAFYLGAEEIVRAMHYSAFFIGMRRVSRGHYEVRFEPLARAQEPLAAGEFTERYAKAVAVQIETAPADWLWSHRRWKLTKPFYGH